MSKQQVVLLSLALHTISIGSMVYAVYLCRREVNLLRSHIKHLDHQLQQEAERSTLPANAR